MSLMMVGASRRGDSLPAELRIPEQFRNSPYFSAMRLAAGQAGLTNPRYRGMRGLGQDDGSDGGDLGMDTSVIDTGNTGITLPLPGTLESGAPLPGVSQSVNTTLDALNSGTFFPAGTEPLPQLPGELTPPAGYSGPTVVSPTASAPAAQAGYQWANLLNQSGQTLAKVLAISQGGSSVQLANGTQLVYGSPAAAAAGGGLLNVPGGVTALGSLGNLTPLLLIAGGLVLLMSMERK